jgi:hypothetical protein
MAFIRTFNFQAFYHMPIPIGTVVPPAGTIVQEPPANRGAVGQDRLHCLCPPVRTPSRTKPIAWQRRPVHNFPGDRARLGHLGHGEVS